MDVHRLDTLKLMLLLSQETNEPSQVLCVVTYGTALYSLDFEREISNCPNHY